MSSSKHRISRTSAVLRACGGTHRVVLALTALALAGLGIQLPSTTAYAQSSPSCLWAGTTHTLQATVSAGGWSFRCVGEKGGIARWVKEGRASRASTVPNPGASGSPVGRFSTGAQQPGTEYNDYCVGDQLIEGTEAVYEVVTDSSGFSFWKAASSINHWDFELDSMPSGTWRSSSLCIDGVLS